MRNPAWRGLALCAGDDEVDRRPTRVSLHHIRRFGHTRGEKQIATLDPYRGSEFASSGLAVRAFLRSPARSAGGAARAASPGGRRLIRPQGDLPRAALL